MRDAILDSARRCIIARGHAALSMRAVAAEASVNQSLIHYYFRTKEGLVLAVLDRMSEELLKRQTEMYRTPLSFADKWATACRFYRDDLASGFVRLLVEVTNLGISHPAVGAEIRKIRGRWRTLLEGVVDEALRQFGIRSVSADVVTAYLVAFWFGMEEEMVLGVPEDEGHYWSSLAAFERFLRWLETGSGEGRRPTLA